MDSPKIDEALQIALDAGATQARIIYSNAVQNVFSVFNDRIDRIHSCCDNSITFYLMVDGRYGSFTTNKLDSDELRRFVGNAVNLVSLLEKDPYRRLPEKELYYKGGVGDLHLCDPSFNNIPINLKKELALSAAAEIRDIAAERFAGAETSFEDSYCTSILADTNGFFGKDEATSFMISANSSLQDKDGSLPESHWYERSLYFDRLNASGCGRTAAERGIAALGPKRLKAGKYGIVIENCVASKFIMPILDALDGYSIDQNDTFLKDSLGKKVLPDHLTIKDVPHKPAMFGATCFDSEGVATKFADIIKDGIVETYLLDTYYSAKLGMKPGYGEYSSVELEPFGQAANIGQMMVAMDRGVLVTGFNGGNYNHVTGDFSYGIQGFYFDKGSIVHPVREMNITGNFLDLFEGLAAVGSDGRNVSAVRVPTLAFVSGNLA